MKLCIAFAALALAGAATGLAVSGASAQDQTAPPARTAAAKAASLKADRSANKASQPHMLFLSPSGEPFHQGPSDPDPLRTWFEQADTGRLGYLDKAEFRADAARFFKKLDENGDGVIDGFEVQDYETKLAPELAEWDDGSYPGEYAPQRPQGRGGGSGGGSGRGHARSESGAPSPANGQPAGQRSTGRARAIQQLIEEPEPVSGADFNLDSHITLDEWMRATDQRFEILDAAKNGRLTLDELRIRLNNPPKAPKR